MMIPIDLPSSSGSGVDFVALGECSLDHIGLLAEGWPRPDGKYALARLLLAPGGQAATASLACRRLGWTSRFVGCVGDDEAGETTLAGLREAGVDVRAVVRPGCGSRQAIVLVDRATATRTVLGARPAPLRLAPSDIDPLWIATARLVLVDASDAGAALAAAGIARAHGRPVMIDLDGPCPEAEALLRSTDVVVVPESGLPGLVDTSDAGAGLPRLAALSGAGVVVVTLGGRGAIGLSGGEECRVEAPQVEVVDTTGAGDAFRGGFAAGWLRHGPGAGLRDVLAYASTVAALSCRAAGAQSALPRAAEVEALL
jgi:sugar/nucleoside kinase (ribokinase family)